MNLLKISIIACLILSCMCILRKKKSAKSVLKQDTYNDYSKAIYETLRDQKDAALLWSSKLSQIALQEATEISTNDDFSKHARFTQWSAQAPNDYFTEFSVMVDTDALPSTEEFAAAIIDALYSQQNDYLTHEETHCGVGMIQSVENKYIVTIQMLKKPKYYSSCKDQLFFSEDNLEIEIYTTDGKLTTVSCDITTDDGGWTKIKDSAVQSKSAYVEIDDLGIKYTELLWVAKSNYFMDLNSDWSNDWDFNGWNFEINMFQFDDQWYISKEFPTHNSVSSNDIRGSGFNNIKQDVEYYKIEDSITSLSEASKCFIRAVQIDPMFCSTKFIMKDLPGRITAISDVETLSQVDNSDNIYDLYFSIYVR